MAPSLSFLSPSFLPSPPPPPPPPPPLPLLLPSNFFLPPHPIQCSGTSRCMRGGLTVKAFAEGGDQRDGLVLSARRQAAIALTLGLFLLPTGHAANSEEVAPSSSPSSGPFGRYMKRRKLNPLEDYIPPIILCRNQFKEVEDKLLAETPLYVDARSLLRSGPLGSLRTDIRAVADYAFEAGKGKMAADAVELCLRSLEDLDSLMLRASRDDTSVTIDSMRSKIEMARTAINNLLETVPTPILDKGEAMILDYLTAAEALSLESR